MTTDTTTSQLPGGVNRRETLLALMGLTAIAAGCGGGGGGVAGVGSGGTGSFSVGPITGFGSVIVNGIRFDDSAASVTDDDGNDLRGKLKLGMLATVKGGAVSGTSASATSVVISGELVGRVANLNSGAQTFTAMGQLVKVTGSTVFDVSLPNSFASLAADTVVEVHGVVDTTNNSIQATYIEKKNAPSLFRITGKIDGLNTSATTFRIGSITINYATAEVRVSPLANGALARVRVNAVQPPTAEPAVWIATRVRPPENANEDRNEAEIEGIITDFTSTSSFSVYGQPVNAAGASFPEGTAGIVLGARVEVKGSLVSGTLVATRVKLEDENDIDNLEFELHGTVSELTATQFKLTPRSGPAITVLFTGTVAGLADGSRVEAKGTVNNSGTAGTVIQATSVRIDN